MVAGRLLLFVVYCVLCGDCCLLFVVRWLMFVLCRVLFVACCVLFVAWCWLFGVRCFGECCLWVAV